MLAADEVVDALTARGATLVTGVPCSLIAPLIDAAAGHSRLRYVGATNEGEAAAIAAGTWLAGGTGIVLCQNSGLGNMVSPLTSLAHPARTPFAVVCGWRGRPGTLDEPQHSLMGEVTEGLLRLLDVSVATLGPDRAAIDPALDGLWHDMATFERPACLLIAKGTLAPRPAVAPPATTRDSGSAPVDLGGSPRASRAAVLERILAVLDDDVAVIATTGMTSRELYALCDRAQHFYLVGAMGCASAVGLGVTLQSGRRTLVLDGDGAALMRLGNFATIGAEAPTGLLHVVLDNGVHDSTGGQPTASGTTRFATIAAGCGYRTSISCSALDDLEHALRLAVAEPGPHLVHVRHLPGAAPDLGRPALAPHEVARRFRAFLATTSTRGTCASC